MSIQKHTQTWYTNDDEFKFDLEPIEDTLTITKTPTGYIAKYLVHDEYYDQSPDDWCDEGIFLVHYHRDFTIERKNIIVKDDLAQWYREGSCPQEKEYRIFPVAAYIHSGIRLALGDGGHFPDQRWDVSHVGAVLVSRKEFKTEKKALKAAQSVIDDWNCALSGDIYGCVIEEFNEDKNSIKNSSVWGYYGYKNAQKELENFSF